MKALTVLDIKGYLRKARMMRVRRIKWAAALLPGVLVWVFETVRHTFFDDDAPMWIGNVLATAVVLCVSVTFAHIAFGIIARTHTRLVAQNQELARLNAQVAEMAVLTERSRLAREMHDGQAQVLAFVMLKAETVTDLLARKRYVDAAREADAIRLACNDAYGDVREAIVALRSDISDSSRFVVELRDTLDRAADAAGFDATLTLEDVSDDALTEIVTPTMAVQLVRVVQEALANVRKHAAAQYVWLTLRATTANGNTAADSGASPVQLILEISDDGRGFVPEMVAAQPGGHVGLAVMRERIADLGGTFEVTSVQGAGTHLIISVPCLSGRIGARR